MSDSESDREAQEEEGFLSRWSRRKQRATGAITELPDDPADAVMPMPASAEHSAAMETTTAAEDLPGDSDMPPVDSLDEDSDYSGFMSPNVSDELRNLALRKLFGSGAFNQRDGLDDYDDDFTSFEKLGDVITAEMRHQMARVKDAMEGEPGEVIAAEDGDAEASNVSQPVQDAAEVSATEKLPGDEGAAEADIENFAKNDSELAFSVPVQARGHEQSTKE